MGVKNEGNYFEKVNGSAPGYRDINSVEALSDDSGSGSGSTSGPTIFFDLIFS